VPKKCHVFFEWPFNTILMFVSAEGISNNLANYMTMALDPNVGHLVRYMTREVPDYPRLLEQLQEELDTKLSTSNMTILELFHKVAIK
jgi:hypothetical protein